MLARIKTLKELGEEYRIKGNYVENDKGESFPGKYMNKIYNFEVRNIPISYISYKCQEIGVWFYKEELVFINTKLSKLLYE